MVRCLDVRQLGGILSVGSKQLTDFLVGQHESPKWFDVMHYILIKLVFIADSCSHTRVWRETLTGMESGIFTVVLYISAAAAEFGMRIGSQWADRL